MERPSEALAPSSALSAAYFGFAHLALASALLVLLFDPALPARVFYQPKVIALVHLVTVGWLSSSILGAFYIVGPLALRLPMPVGVADWIVFGIFAIGAAGAISHFWIATYSGMAWSGVMVITAFAWVAVRAWRGLPHAKAPAAVKLHVALAFFNVLAAGGFGVAIGFDRSLGLWGLPATGALFAHAHLAAIGWVMMMVIGLAYRLMPMMLPAAMPTGRALFASAILIETGLAILFFALLRGSDWLIAGALAIVAGIASFIRQIATIVRRMKPRPPALPRRDWSTWQAFGALSWLVVAVACGLGLTLGGYGDWRVTVTWLYGVGGLVGFLAQMVAGVQGRIVPWYAWYRAQAIAGGASPPVGANQLPSAPLARLVFFGWTGGVPLLAAGLALGIAPMVRLAAASILTGVAAGALHLVVMARRASRRRSDAD